jgi:hypothetical protein
MFHLISVTFEISDLAACVWVSWWGKMATDELG